MQKRECHGTKDVPVSDIVVKNRLRPVSESGVATLVASIEQLGLIKDPIHLRQVGGAHARLELIAGGHRLQAAKRLDWATIPATIWTCSADWARLMEVDDNLAQSDMDALELAVFLAERKRVYLKLHPQSKRGGDRGNQHTGGRQSDIVSFCQSTAEKRAMSKRQIERLVSAGERLDPKHAAQLFALESRPTLADLTHLGKMQPDQRQLALDLFVVGTEPTIKAAHASLEGSKPPLSNKDRRVQSLVDAWDRAGKAARDAFFEERGEEMHRAFRAWAEAKGVPEAFVLVRTKDGSAG